MISLGPDSGQSMGSQSSCSSGKSPAPGLFRERLPIGYKVASLQHGMMRFDYPALLQRREGFTIASKELPAGSLLPGICFGHDYVSSLKRLSPPSAQSGLGWVIKSGSQGPAASHTGTARVSCPQQQPPPLASL